MARGQLKPIGDKGSPNHIDVILANWSRWHSIPLGQKSHFGASISAGTCHGHLCFYVDQRGHGLARVQAQFPFNSRWERRRAWKAARKVFEALR